MGRIQRPVWNANAEVKRCFQLIAQTVQKDESNRNTSRLAIRINDLLLSMLDLLRVPAAEAMKMSPGSRHAVRMLLDRLARDRERVAEQWTGERMAAACGLKPTRFVTHVRDLTNVAPMHYLNSCRLEQACQFAEGLLVDERHRDRVRARLLIKPILRDPIHIQAAFRRGADGV